MPITILDYVRTVVGDKDTYCAEDFHRHGVGMTGGCQLCAASIACYNAFPSTSGYWRCADCIGNDGYATIADFTASELTICSSCGNQAQVPFKPRMDRPVYCSDCFRKAHPD